MNRLGLPLLPGRYTLSNALRVRVEEKNSKLYIASKNSETVTLMLEITTTIHNDRGWTVYYLLHKKEQKAHLSKTPFE